MIIYVDLECIIEKTDGYKNNPENSSTTKVDEHIPSGFSMSAISSFRSIENRHDVCRGKDSMKKFCEFLRLHAMKIINFKNKKMKLLTKEQQESYENAKICYICKEKFKNIVKLEITVIIQKNKEVLHKAYVIYNIKHLKKNSCSFS